MTCPFAKFASLFPVAPAANATSPYHAMHGFHPTASKSTSSSSAAAAAAAAAATSLSEALRVGTSSSHRAVEKSLGVSLLLHSSPSASTSELTFDRLDYTRFNIMLACIYVVLEASLYRRRDTALLEPLFGDDDGGLMRALARTRWLLEDITAHLEVICSVSGVTLAELAESEREERAFATTLTGAQGSREKLWQLVSTSSPTAARLSSTPLLHLDLTADHLDLLTPAQVDSTLDYVATLHTLASSRTGSGLLLAHAYTRYLGDLSGGQHIVRKVSKRFPVPHERGFRFYAFDASTDLKRRFRDAMETGFARDARKQALVEEANRAFDLNTALFESLLPPELRMRDDSLDEKPKAAAAAAEQSQVSIATGVGDKGWMSGDMAVLGGVVVAATAALVVASMLSAGGVGDAVGVHA